MKTISWASIHCERFAIKTFRLSIEFRQDSEISKPTGDGMLRVANPEPAPGSPDACAIYSICVLAIGRRYSTSDDSRGLIREPANRLRKCSKAPRGGRQLSSCQRVRNSASDSHRDRPRVLSPARSIRSTSNRTRRTQFIQLSVHCVAARQPSPRSNLSILGSLGMYGWEEQRSAHTSRDASILRWRCRRKASFDATMVPNRYERRSGSRRTE